MPKKLTKTITRHYVLLLLLLVPAFLVRLYRIDSPLADWHSWRQSDTASVTREFIKHDYSILESHYQDLSNIPSGLDNVAGYRMVEFPLVNYLLAQFLRSFPQLDLVVTSRLASVVTSLFSLIFLYFIVWKLSKDKLTSFLSGALFAFLPYSIYYSRTILPEPFMITFQLLSLLAFIAWLEQKQKNSLLATGYWLISVIALALALLLKPVAIFAAPVYIVLAFAYLGWKTFTTWQLYLFPLAFLPLGAWRVWIQDFPSGIPANRWLFNGNGIRLKPAWWRWLFAERIAKLILGYWGTVFLSLGLIAKTKLKIFDTFALAYAAGMFLYLVVFATGNVQHDYYQSILMPIIAILAARGTVFLLKISKDFAYPILSWGLVAMLWLLAFGFSYYSVIGYFNINNPAIVSAGERVDQITEQDAKIIAPYMGDTAFLFQTNRTGWPIGGEIEKKITLGANYYVSTTYDEEAKSLEEKYQVLEKTPEYIIIDLQNKAKL